MLIFSMRNTGPTLQYRHSLERIVFPIVSCIFNECPISLGPASFRQIYLAFWIPWTNFSMFDSFLIRSLTQTQPHMFSGVTVPFFRWIVRSPLSYHMNNDG